VQVICHSEGALATEESLAAGWQEKKCSDVSVQERKILRRPIMMCQLTKCNAGLFTMTSAGEFVILRERHAVVDGGEENIEAYFD
jgi:hypothetical protein